MTKNKVYAALLIVLLGIKFVIMPWFDWTEEQASENNRLSTLNQKQAFAIANKNVLNEQLKSKTSVLDAYRNNIAKVSSEQAARLKWLTIAQPLKNIGLNVYNQEVDDVYPVVEGLYTVSGTLSISGEAETVLEALVGLEQDDTGIFISEVKLNKPGRAKENQLIVQLIIGQWFSVVGE